MVATNKRGLLVFRSFEQSDCAEQRWFGVTAGIRVSHPTIDTQLSN